MKAVGLVLLGGLVIFIAVAAALKWDRVQQQQEMAAAIKEANGEAQRERDMADWERESKERQRERDAVKNAIKLNPAIITVTVLAFIAVGIGVEWVRSRGASQ